MRYLVEEHSHGRDETHLEVCNISHTDREPVCEIMNKIANQCKHCKRAVSVLLFILWLDSTFFLLTTMIMMVMLIEIFLCHLFDYEKCPYTENDIEVYLHFFF